MKRIFTLMILFLTMLSVTSAFSADFQKGMDAAKRQDFTTALEEWLPLAEQGHSNAQYYLGSMYYNGHGVVQNYKTAIKWGTLAAKQGHARAN